MYQKKPYLIQISLADHQALLRMHESAANAGCLTEYQPINDRTLWFVADQLVAVSRGPLGSNSDYWSVVHLTDYQRELAADQACNNDVSSDEEFLEFLWTEGKISRSERQAILLERSRCLTAPLHEPLRTEFQP